MDQNHRFYKIAVHDLKRRGEDPGRPEEDKPDEPREPRAATDDVEWIAAIDSAGRGVRGAQIAIFVPGSDRPSARVATDDQGRFRIPARLADEHRELELHVTAEGRFPRGANGVDAIRLKRTPAGTWNFTRVALLRSAQLAGTVLDGEGKATGRSAFVAFTTSDDSVACSSFAADNGGYIKPTVLLPDTIHTTGFVGSWGQSPGLDLGVREVLQHSLLTPACGLGYLSPEEATRGLKLLDELGRRARQWLASQA